MRQRVVAEQMSDSFEIAQDKARTLGRSRNSLTMAIFKGRVSQQRPTRLWHPFFSCLQPSGGSFPGLTSKPIFVTL